MKGLKERIRSCQVCADLALGPRPVVQLDEGARLLIIGQAPGTKVHDTGIPWNDASGERLRDWLGLTSDDFYDASKLAIMPMGFCYPGKVPKGGDKPPRKECAPLWHDEILARLPNVELTLLVGSYAQKYYLGNRRASTLGETVLNYRAYEEEGYFPLPHPSWRVQNWITKTPIFEKDVLQALKMRVAALFSQ